MVGLTWKQFQLTVIKDCPKCELRDGRWRHHGYHGMKISNYGGTWNDSYHMHDGSGWLSLVWPFMLPVFAGKMIGSRKATKSVRAMEQAAVDDIRRNNELAEAKHQAQLAKVRAEEDEYLTKQLKDK